MPRRRKSPKRREWNDPSYNDPTPMEFFLRTIRNTGVPADFQARLQGLTEVRRGPLVQRMLFD